jgi:hypothetical protein
MKTFQEYCEERKDEGLGSFMRGIVNPDYKALPQILKDIYDSLNSSQHAHLKQLMKYNYMSLAQALQSLPNIDPMLTMKLHNRGGTYNPMSSAEKPRWAEQKK